MATKYFDDEMLKEALHIYEEKLVSELPGEDELATITFSEKFEKKMKKTIAEQNRAFSFSMSKVLRIAVCLILVLAIIVSATICVGASHRKFFEYVEKKFEKYSELIFVHNSKISQSDFEVYVPKYVPEGYFITKWQKPPQYLTNSIFYEDKYKNCLTYTQSLPENSYLINTEGVDTEQIFINDYEGVYYTNKGMRSIIYTDGNYSHMFTCNEKGLSKEKFIKIAASIRPMKSNK